MATASPVVPRQTRSQTFVLVLRELQPLNFDLSLVLLQCSERPQAMTHKQQLYTSLSSLVKHARKMAKRQSAAPLTRSQTALVWERDLLGCAFIRVTSGVHLLEFGEFFCSWSGTKKPPPALGRAAKARRELEGDGGGFETVLVAFSRPVSRQVAAKTVAELATCPVVSASSFVTYLSLG